MIKNIIIGILGCLLLIASGFICYDKLLKKNDTKNNCNCPKCEEKRTLKTCTVDMEGKTTEDAIKVCGEDFSLNDYREIVIKNVKIDDKVMNVTYFFERDEDPDNGLVKIFVDGTLFEAHIGLYANVLSKIEIKDNALALTQGSHTNIPASERIYAIYGDSPNKEAIEIDY